MNNKKLVLLFSILGKVFNWQFGEAPQWGPANDKARKFVNN